MFVFSRVLGLIYLSICLVQDLVETKSRQKRCIVIQKQSGTHGDSTEQDGDEEYRKPQLKEPMPDRLRQPYSNGGNDHRDAEEISPEFMKYRILPIQMRPANSEHRLRKRLIKKYLS